MELEALVCNYEDCNLIYENPVTLPCGKSICKQHLEQYENDEKYKCCFCKEQHEIPKNGFVVNNSFDSNNKKINYENAAKVIQDENQKVFNLILFYH